MHQLVRGLTLEICHLFIGDNYEEVINHLYDFAAEVGRMESDGRLSSKQANLFRP